LGVIDEERSGGSEEKRKSASEEVGRRVVSEVRGMHK
jgi:hypothetical protein